MHETDAYLGPTRSLPFFPGSHMIGDVARPFTQRLIFHLEFRLLVYSTHSIILSMFFEVTAGKPKSPAPYPHQHTKIS